MTSKTCCIRRAIGRALEQAVDQGRPLVGRGVVQERPGLGRRRDHAGQVEPGAAEELAVGGRRGGRLARQLSAPAPPRSAGRSARAAGPGASDCGGRRLRRGGRGRGLRFRRRRPWPLRLLAGDGLRAGQDRRRTQQDRGREDDPGRRPPSSRCPILSLAPERLRRIRSGPTRALPHAHDAPRGCIHDGSKFKRLLNYRVTCGGATRLPRIVEASIPPAHARGVLGTSLAGHASG